MLTSSNWRFNVTEAWPWTVAEDDGESFKNRSATEREWWLFLFSFLLFLKICFKNFIFIFLRVLWLFPFSSLSIHSVFSSNQMRQSVPILIYIYVISIMLMSYSFNPFPFLFLFLFFPLFLRIKLVVYVDKIMLKFYKPACEYEYIPQSQESYWELAVQLPIKASK